MPTFIIESQTYCYEDGLSDWDYHQQRNLKSRRGRGAGLEPQVRVHLVPPTARVTQGARQEVGVFAGFRPCGPDRFVIR